MSTKLLVDQFSHAPRLEYVFVKDSGHFLVLQKPTEIALLITDYVFGKSKSKL